MNLKKTLLFLFGLGALIIVMSSEFSPEVAVNGDEGEILAARRRKKKFTTPHEKNGGSFYPRCPPGKVEFDHCC